MAHKSRFAFLFGLLVILGLAAAPAQATEIIDFGTGGAIGIGTVSYSGGSAPLIGTNIGIGLVNAFGTPLNAGSYVVTGTNGGWGSLDFTTGAYQSYSGGVYTFAAGGTFTITGAVNTAGAGSCGNPCNVVNLLTGTFTSVSINQPSAFSQGSVSFAGIDTKNADLLAFFGIPAGQGFTFGGFTIGFPLFGGGGGAFSDLSLSTDVVNNVPVPEPASLLLLGSGLTALGTYIRRRNLKQNAKQTLS